MFVESSNTPDLVANYQAASLKGDPLLYPGKRPDENGKGARRTVLSSIGKHYRRMLPPV